MIITRVESVKGRVAYNLTKEPPVVTVTGKSYTVMAPWLASPAPLDNNEDGAIIVAHDSDDLPILCIWTGRDEDRLIPKGIHDIVISDGVETIEYKLTYNGKNHIDLKEKTPAKVAKK